MLLTAWRWRLAALVVLTATSGHAAACVTEARATLALRLTDQVLTVPVEVNGMTGTFILDTGAERSVVSDAAVARLNLARDPWVGTTMGGVGGIDRRPNANPRSLSLGGIPLARQTLSHDSSLTVAAFPMAQVDNLAIDGLLGRDYLSLFDLDLDLPNRRLTLFRVRDCNGRFLPWSGRYEAVPVTMPTKNALVVPVLLDTTPLRALLDTGASASLLGAPGMARMGLTVGSVANDPSDQVRGLGPRVVVMRRHTFGSLKVAGLTVVAPEVWVAPIRLTPIVDMLLGEDWLESRRIWISYATQQLFVASP